MDEQQEQLSIREKARRAYEERASEVKARMMEKRAEDAGWVKRIFGVEMHDFTAEGIGVRIERYAGGICGLQVADITGKWSTPCTTWAELGEQLEPDTFTADDPTAPASTWHDDLLDAIERGLIERGRL